MDLSAHLVRHIYIFPLLETKSMSKNIERILTALHQLLSESKLSDKSSVSLNILLLKIVEKALSLTNQL